MKNIFLLIPGKSEKRGGGEKLSRCEEAWCAVPFFFVLYFLPHVACLRGMKSVPCQYPGVLTGRLQAGGLGRDGLQLPRCSARTPPSSAKVVVMFI